VRCFNEQRAYRNTEDTSAVLHLSSTILYISLITIEPFPLAASLVT